MSTLADLLSEPDAWSDRVALATAIAADLGVADDVADRIAANLAESEQVRRRHHQVSEATDDVVQGVAAAVYALELDDPPRVERYLRQTLHAASLLMTDLVADGLAGPGREHTLRRSTPADLTDRRAV